MTANDVALSQRVGAMYVAACEEIFAAYGVGIQLHEPLTDSLGQGTASYVSLIGEDGHDFSLTLVLISDDALLAASYPAILTPEMAIDLQDWCRELSNQLGGRLTQKLFACGCEVTLGLAKLITVEGLSRIHDPDADVHSFWFTSTRGSVLARLSMRFAPDFQLAAVAASPDGMSMYYDGAQILF